MAHPHIKCRINQIYNSSFSGSVLWDLSGENTNQLINSWSVAVRHMWSLPLNSHRYFIEPLGGMHAKTMLMCRYVSFIQSIRKSARPGVIYLLQKVMNNVETVTGRNINYILRETGNDDIFKIRVGQIKKNYSFCDLPATEQWKIDFVKEVVNVKQNILELNENLMTNEDLDTIIEYITTC